MHEDRCQRHGWGDTSLTKQDGYSGVLHPRREQPLRIGKGQAPAMFGADGRSDLFATMQFQSHVVPTPDSWIGNALMDPTKMKGFPARPRDAKGRTDLFEVLQSVSPGVPSDDAWLGHMKINPAVGKAHPPGPEQTRGRADLGEVFSQQILRETKERRQELTDNNGAQDPYCDGWIGNRLVNPVSGKMPVQAAAANESLLASTFRSNAPGHTDMPRPHSKAVPGMPGPSSVGDVLKGGAATLGGEFGKRGKKELDPAIGATILPPRKDNLYAHMTYRPLADAEKSALAKGYDDGRHHERRHNQAPGQDGPQTGPDMLAWKPEVRVGTYIPFAGLAQQQGTMPRKPLRVGALDCAVTADRLSESIRRQK
ncbi:hypothetical protein FOA52_006655 [Chlamydomonas sp. UWO 241]|nr:hypothetical protein FOA52_006655 [Chlamydomonas sp. UWO 241]